MEQRVALITGAASGIGRTVAQALAEDQCRVVLVDRDEEKGNETSCEVGGYFIASDLTSTNSCRELVEETLEEYGRIDILVNNAGFQHVAPIESFPETKWNQMLALMLTAPFLLTKYVWKSMKTRGFGRIVNISSIHGLVASPLKSAYVAAKHGMIGLTKVCALEGGESGITVNAICPAYVRTPLVENQIADQARNLGISESEVVEKVMLEPAAIKRLIQPEEIGTLVVFLCSDSASAVTGAAWTIDLGWTAH
jgi:3-hydroxybutyrate dehydrogenase